MEMLIDIDICNKLYLFYIIDNENKQIIPYKSEYVTDTIEFILNKHKQFNIQRIGFYGIEGYMYPLYEGLKYHDLYIVNRIDIYKWRMKLEVKLRKITNAIYIYTLEGRYKYVSEEEYLNNRGD